MCHSIAENRSRVGLAPFAGTNAIWGLSSLYVIGGFQYGSVTEDANTGFAAHRHGKMADVHILYYQFQPVLTVSVTHLFILHDRQN